MENSLLSVLVNVTCYLPGEGGTQIWYSVYMHDYFFEHILNKFLSIFKSYHKQDLQAFGEEI